jgi:hypothetical protein
MPRVFDPEFWSDAHWQRSSLFLSAPASIRFAGNTPFSTLLR